MNNENVREIIKTCTFPYKRLFMNESDVMEMYHNLINYKAKFLSGKYRLNVTTDKHLIPWNYKGNQIVLPIGNDEYEKIDVITDYFSEENRMRAKMVYMEKSPFDLWNDDKFVTKIVNNLIEANKDIHEVNLKELREQIYQNTSEATQFKTTLALSFYRKFNAKNILDISAGWGDRLIAAIAHGVDKYLAYDPNKDLKKAHDEIINMFGQGNHEKYEIIYEPFEKAKLPNIEFDLVFSSPPYFNLEEYTDLEGQSIKSYPIFEDWLVKFLFKSLYIAWNNLKVDGNVVIHMTDLKNDKIIEPMTLFIVSFLKGAWYDGVIPTFNQDNKNHKYIKYRPLWVYKKYNYVNKNELYKYTKLFKSKYLSIYNKCLKEFS